MNRLKYFGLLLVSYLLTSCFDSSPPEEPTPKPPETSEASAGDSGSSDPEEEMSFPEALKLKRSLAKDLAKLEEELAEAKNPSSEGAIAVKTLEEIAQYTTSLTEAQAAITESLEFWRTETRNSFEGVKLPEMITSSGTLYRAVTITEVGDEQLVISHEGGTATVPIAELTIGLRKNLIHEPTVLSEIQ